MTMTKIYNFGAGPAMVAQEVLQRAHEEFFDWNGTGMNVMEVGHRGNDFVEFAEQTEITLRQLLNIPDHYKVLFLSGGATSQFAMVPINLLGNKTSADYLVTGFWSEKACAEAQKFCHVNLVASTKEEGYQNIPAPRTWQLNAQAAYLYYTANETINGVEFQDIPESFGVPLVSDMSSNLLSRPLDVSRFGCIFACAQKNFGQAGITVVIVREDLLGQVLPAMPTMFDYQKHAEQGSMLNTPPTYAWYITALTLDWYRQLGGLQVIEQRNRQKAQLLYDAIDASHLYNNSVNPHFRSLMNIPFRLAREELESIFLKEAKQSGLVNLKGHRMVGGMRASIYNAMPLAGVTTLIDFMRDFEKRHA